MLPSFKNELRGYVLTQWLGSGGMGEVYQAQHRSSGLVVAIKILHQKDQYDRFQNEAQLQASLQHPNITRIYEYVEDKGFPCIIMEYIEGLTVDRLIKKKGAIPELPALRIFKQIVSAVAYLHQRGIFHRDLKPCNIKVTKTMEVKLLDFGIAKTGDSPRLTQEGFLVGSSKYMAPEQFHDGGGLPSDCWALGIILYEMLSGKIPFDGKTDASIRHAIEHGRVDTEFLRHAGISKESIHLIKRLLDQNPKNRAKATDLFSKENQTGESASMWDHLSSKVKKWIP